MSKTKNRVCLYADGITDKDGILVMLVTENVAGYKDTGIRLEKGDDYYDIIDRANVILYNIYHKEMRAIVRSSMFPAKRK